MNDNKMQKYEYIILKGENVIKDQESGSKSIFPIEVEKAHQLKLYKTDVKTSVGDRKKACDYLLVCDENEYKIACLTELKGTHKINEVKDALIQIGTSLEALKQNYMRGTKIAIGIVVGAPDKTLPKMISSDTRGLCKKLYSQCEDKRKIKNMDNLLIYVQPEKGIKKAIVIGKNSAKIIKCHSKSGAHVPVPSMFIEIATKGG